MDTALAVAVRIPQSKEKKCTLIQLVDLWRGGKEGVPPEVAKEAKAMSRDINEVRDPQLAYMWLLK